MNKKEYIKKAKQEIINRVKFHAPIVYDDVVDRKILMDNGIDFNLPIFHFDKALNKNLLKAIEMAQNECDFNVVFSQNSLGKIKENKLKKLKNFFVTTKYSSSRLIENIKKLNINYCSYSNFNLKFQDKFFRVNNKILNPCFDNFFLTCKNNFDDVFVEYKEFVLNGNNVFVKFINTAKTAKKIECEFNFPLKNGYYLFKRLEKCIFIENIITKEKMYFSFNCGAAKFDFSAVNGLENSKYCCINIKYSLNLKGKQMAYSFFNFGNEKFLPKNLNSVSKFCDLSQKMCFSEFDIMVKTKNFEFDDFLNKTMPMRTWLGWLNFERNFSLEEKYKTYRKLFLKGKDKIVFTNFAQLGVREIFIFNGMDYKKISIVLSNEKFLKIGKTCFWGTNSLSTKSLKTVEPIVFSLG